jgi:SPW repeat
MSNATEVERVVANDGGNRSGRGAVALHASTDSRVVNNAGSTNNPMEDVGSKGDQFILASWATLAAGLWVALAPWVLTFAGYAPNARANDLVLGALIASMGATRVFGHYRSGRLNQVISALTVLPGIWLIAAPFVLGYTDRTRPMTSDIIAGIAVIVFALWSYMTSRDDSYATADTPR